MLGTVGRKTSIRKYAASPRMATLATDARLYAVWRPNFEDHTVELRRVDTGELVRRRPMTEFESRRSFAGVGLSNR